MTKDSLRELGALEEKGNTWERIIELWYYVQIQNGSDRYANKFTIEDYHKMLRRYTADWFKRRPQELTRGDGKRVLGNLYVLGKSKSYIMKIKNTINVVFQWAIDNRRVKSHAGNENR